MFIRTFFFVSSSYLTDFHVFFYWKSDLSTFHRRNCFFQGQVHSLSHKKKYMLLWTFIDKKNVVVNCFYLCVCKIPLFSYLSSFGATLRTFERQITFLIYTTLKISSNKRFERARTPIAFITELRCWVCMQYIPIVWYEKIW